MKLDAKFYGTILKVKDDSVVPPDDQYMVFLAKDNAFAEFGTGAIYFYLGRCIELGADQEHINAVKRTIVRLERWRADNPDKLKVPDAKGEKLLA